MFSTPNGKNQKIPHQTPPTKKKNNGHETKRLNNHSIAIPPQKKKKNSCFRCFSPNKWEGIPPRLQAKLALCRANNAERAEA